MRGVVRAKQTDADSLRTRLDVALEYPKGSRHPNGSAPAAGADFVTQRYTTVIAHPDGTRWAVPVDDRATPHLHRPGEEPEELGSDWFPEP